LGIEKLTSDRLSTVYSRSSTIPANSVKIGLVDVEIITLTEIIKNVKKITTLYKSTFAQTVGLVRHDTKMVLFFGITGPKKSPFLSHLSDNPVQT